MILPLSVVVWVGLFTALVLSDIYRLDRKKPKASWLTALELPASALANSSRELLILSAAGLFLELLMIRWISSEISIFAYFKNFVLIACFLGFGLGAYLCRQPMNLLATLAPMTYFVLLIKLPWPPLRELIRRFTALLGSSTEVDMWGVPVMPAGQEAIRGIATIMAIVIPMFVLLSISFIPIGQAIARLMERARDGVLSYSVNIAGSLLGILLYTALCLFYQPPAVWFGVAGVLLILGFKTWRLRVAIGAVIAFATIFVSLPDSNSSVEEVMIPGLDTTGGRTDWSPYQKLHWAETRYQGEVVAYQLMTNDNWYQYVVNLSDRFILSHPALFAGIPPEWNAYNLPYRFYRKPAAVLVLGAGMGNDVAAALRNGAGRVTAVEIDPMILKLGKRLHPERPYADPRVTVVNDDARSYMQNAPDRFNLITFSLLDSHTTSSHYSNIRIDNYVYTQEALTAAKKLLAPDGVMVVKFQVAKPFIAGRLKSTLTEVFGAEPVVFGADQSFNVSPGTFMVSGNRQRIASAVQEPEFKRYLDTHGHVAVAEARATTDDWPFFYQRAPGLPSSVILISLLLIIVCGHLLQRASVPVRDIQWTFFFLGAGFMLLESQIVSRMALLFGTTWLVNAITISGVLFLIVGANMLERANRRLPAPLVYAGLFLTLAIAYLVPVSNLLAESHAVRIAGAVLVLCGPVFFASILFIRTFAAAGFAGTALGSNLFGALVGGLLESLSMWIGLRGLLLLAASLYMASYFTTRKQSVLAPVRSAVPVP